MGGMSTGAWLVGPSDEAVRRIHEALRPFRKEALLDRAEVWLDPDEPGRARLELVWEDLQTARANTKRVLKALSGLETRGTIRLEEGGLKVFTQHPKHSAAETE